MKGINILGLFFQTFGYVLLSIGVFKDAGRKFINFIPWKKKPVEIRILCRLFFGVKSDSEYNRLFSDSYPIPGSFTWKERLILDLPLIALLFIIIGVFLNV